MTSSRFHLSLSVAVLVFGLVACGEEKKPLPPKVEEVEKEWKSTVDGERAMQTVIRLCKEPRVPGTPGHVRAQQLIKAELAAAGVTQIDDQPFETKTPIGMVKFNNIIGVIPGKTKDGIAIGAHYDSKRFTDFPFVGANDAASACGLLVEIGRQLAAKTDRKETIYLIFIDGEEAFNEDWGSQEDGTEDHTYGSRHFVKNMEKYPVKALVLLDMVGDKDLQLVRETNSTPELLAMFEATSKEIYGKSIFGARMDVQDDHIPFLRAEIPAIDLIDFHFGPDGKTHWHTKEDTLDKLSPKSLDRVGTLVLATLPKVAAKYVK
jgi:glutaminyl-peptide cyclotransferase